MEINDQTLNILLVRELQFAIAKLGPVPNEYRDIINQVLDEGHQLDKVMLGLALESSSENLNWHGVRFYCESFLEKKA
jgi:hypothetical protein